MKNTMIQVPLRGAWNKSYATTWEEALVSGNGRQGVMVLGDPHNETIIGNHSRLFLPTGTGLPLPDMGPYLNELRQMIQEKGYDQATHFFYQKAKELGYQGLQMSDPFHPGFHLHIESAFQEIEKYQRSVNFDTGEIAVNFCDENNINHTRKTFVSRPDDIIVHSVENDQEKVSCTLKIEDDAHELIVHQRNMESDRIDLHNTYQNGSGGYQVGIRIIAPHGSVIVHEDRLVIEHAKKLVLLIKIKPYQDIKRIDGHSLHAELNKITASYEELLQKHSKIHQEMFRRVHLQLANEEERKWCTEDLINKAKLTTVLPLALIEKMYDAGRYMFICSAGELSPNLQGIWTGTFNPPWSGDYTFDTNVQLSIASALSSNLLEGIHGFFRLIKELLPGFRENAKSYYGCRGIMAPAHASNSGRHFHWNEEWPLHFWTCGAGWLGHWFYQYYLYTGDKAFLAEETIPYLKECALFYEDFLMEDADGTYRFSPSYSAENGCGDNATQDIAVAKEVLQHLIDGYKELNIDSPEIQKWEHMIDKLPDYRINIEGAIKEWAIENKAENDNHRHFSHLYPIFQSREFTASSEPVLWKASEVAFNNRLEAWLRSDEADTSSTHGRMHAALCATQFNLKELVYEILQMMVLNDSIYPSMITSHYNNHQVFNVDGNGAIPQIINEMLIDATPGNVTLLRALPEQLSKGSIQGVLLPKQLEVKELIWDLEDKKLIVALASKIEQEIDLEAPLYPDLRVDKVMDCTVVEDKKSMKVFLDKNKTGVLHFYL